jgi:lysophospholipase L1-like esterase
MKKHLKWVAVALCTATACLPFTACGSQQDISATLSSDGYLVLNGTKTDILLRQDTEEKTEDSTEEIVVENGKSAYELYVEQNPAYSGNEAQWLADLTAGKLADSKEYTLLSYGRDYNACLEQGSVASANSKLTFSNAVLSLHQNVVLPIETNATWQLEFTGTLTPGGSGGGQLLTSVAYGTNGRIYLGVNNSNGVLFLGVCVGDTYANYCWNVPATTLNGEHTYAIQFANGQYYLAIDGGNAKALSSLNINQSNKTSASGTQLSAELTAKIQAVTGQNYITFSHMGATSHTLNCSLKSFTARTSSIYSYEEKSTHPLANKTIYYLGSSVTRGHGGNTDGTSFADITASLTSNSYQKLAISGTNLAVVSGSSDSYAERLLSFDFTTQPDVLVVQLSTNDFTHNISTGYVSDKTASADMDKTTITGAIEYIISYVKEVSPQTKVVLYTCTLGINLDIYKSYYSYITGTVRQLKQKWNDSLYVLDLLNADYISVSSYMQSDGLHPTKEGYAQLYTPRFISFLADIL